MWMVVGSVQLSALRCSDSLAHVAERSRKREVTDRKQPYSRSLVWLAPVIRNKLLSAQRTSEIRHERPQLPANWCLVYSSEEAELINSLSKTANFYA